MKNLQLSLFMLIAVNGSAKGYEEGEVIQYFKEIALQQEFTDEPQRTKKWTKQLVIFPAGKWPQHLTSELNVILKDLALIAPNLKIQLTKDKTASNYTLFMGSADDYVKYIEPLAIEHVKENYGYFHIYWNSNNEITHGSMYVDTKRAKTKRWQSHLLREELTQSLGLMNDSVAYKDSIFYEKGSSLTSYSDLDVYMIKILYNKKMRPNQSAKKVEVFIKRQQLLKKFKAEKSENIKFSK